METPSYTSACAEAVARLRAASTVHVVHHWDADGLASAAIIERYLRKWKGVITYAVPEIGEYSSDAVSPPPQPVDEFVLVDYGIPSEEIAKIGGAVGREPIIFDHHASGVKGRGKCNPISYGNGWEDWSATAVVIAEAAGIRPEGWKELAALAVYGDVGFEGLMRKPHLLSATFRAGLRVEELEKAARYVNSCYRAVDYACIDIAREELTEGGVQAVLRNGYLAAKETEVCAEVDRGVNVALSSAEVVGRGITIYRARLKAYIVSAVGRRLSKILGNGVAVLVAYVEPMKRWYLYARSQDRVIRDAIHALRNAGYGAGGKDKVVSTPCVEDGCKGELSTLLRALTGNP